MEVAFQSKKVYDVIRLDQKPVVAPGTRGKNELQEHIDAWEKKKTPMKGCLSVQVYLGKLF